MPTKLRVAGVWTGHIEVPGLDICTVGHLIREIANRAGFEADEIRIICAGKTLQETGKGLTLSEAGLKENSKLLVTRSSAAAVENIVAESERSARLSRLRAAAEKLARERRDGEALHDGFDFQLENQNGQALAFDSEDDRRALVSGLMLHTTGRRLLDKGQIAAALEVLDLAEEAFNLCCRDHLEAVDNVAMLQLDIVWCLFLLKDISRLSNARSRLSVALRGLQRSHGADMGRMRQLQGGFCPGLATYGCRYVRLEVLQGVAAYHCGDGGAARDFLLSAKSKASKLEVSNDALCEVMSLGFKVKESRRALRMSGQSVGRAVEFVMEQREKEEAERRREEQRRVERREQIGLGMTVGGKVVNLTVLNQLCHLGYDRQLAACALREAENDFQQTLDLLSHAETYERLQMQTAGSSKKRKATIADPQALAFMLGIGYECEAATKALLIADNDVSSAVSTLLAGNTTSPNTPLGQTEAGNEQGRPSHLEGFAAELAEEGGEERDVEMEEELTKDVKGDPYAEYDVSVIEETEAIEEYLALIESSLLAK